MSNNTTDSVRTAAKRRLAIYLIVTFTLTWGLIIPLCFKLGAFENGELATAGIVAPIAISMFFPLIGAFVANLACGKENRINLLSGYFQFIFLSFLLSLEYQPFPPATLRNSYKQVESTNLAIYLSFRNLHPRWCNYIAPDHD